MNSGIYTAYSGMRAQMQALDILANNLANLNTTGFKEGKAFHSVLREALGSGGRTAALEAALNSQVVLGDGMVNLADGSLLHTNRDLDIALVGNGFLVVQAPQGTRYTRNGNLIVTAQSQLATAEGLPVLGENGPISVGPGRLSIDSSGQVQLDGALIDRLRLVAFESPQMLAREGNSLLAPSSEEAVTVPASVEIRQGYLEQSNVNAVSAVVEMVQILRRYEAIQKSIHLLMNDMNAKAIDRLGR